MEFHTQMFNTLRLNVFLYYTCNTVIRSFSTPLLFQCHSHNITDSAQKVCFWKWIFQNMLTRNSIKCQIYFEFRFWFNIRNFLCIHSKLQRAQTSSSFWRGRYFSIRILYCIYTISCLWKTHDPRF